MQSVHIMHSTSHSRTHKGTVHKDPPGLVPLRHSTTQTPCWRSGHTKHPAWVPLTHCVQPSTQGTHSVPAKKVPFLQTHSIPDCTVLGGHWLTHSSRLSDEAFWHGTKVSIPSDMYRFVQLKFTHHWKIHSIHYIVYGRCWHWAELSLLAAVRGAKHSTWASRTVLCWTDITTYQPCAETERGVEEGGKWKSREMEEEWQDWWVSHCVNRGGACRWTEH